MFSRFYPKYNPAISVFSVPAYHGKHQVIVAPWSYANDTEKSKETEHHITASEPEKPFKNHPLEQNEEIGEGEEEVEVDTTEEYKEQYKTIDFSRPPPAYDAVAESESEKSPEKEVSLTFLAVQHTYII